MKVYREGLSSCEKLDASEAVCIRLRQLQQKLQPQIIHSFIPFGSEIDIWPVVKEWAQKGITVVCPKTLKNRQLQHLVLQDDMCLEIGRFGTQHPKGGNEYSGEIGLILVPGLAFDGNGGRLGYGAGYYDTFLSQHPEAFKVGVCFKEQLVHQVPTEAHDVNLDQVIVG